MAEKIAWPITIVLLVWWFNAATWLAYTVFDCSVLCSMASGLVWSAVMMRKIMIMLDVEVNMKSLQKVWLRISGREFRGQSWQETEASIERKYTMAWIMVRGAGAHFEDTIYCCNMLSLEGEDFSIDCVPKEVWELVKVGGVLPVKYRVSRIDGTKRQWKLDSDKISVVKKVERKLVIKK